jgi:micrococcal nuclease
VEPFTYRATVLRVLDGDTLTVDVDLGFGLHHRGDTSKGLPLRLAGCNARELHDPGGQEARDHLAALLPAGTVLTLRTVRPDKYGGRYDALVDHDGRDLATYLIATGWAAAWNGAGARPVPPWPNTFAPEGNP